MLTPPRNEENCFYMVDWNKLVGCTHAGGPGCKHCPLQNLAGVYGQFKKLGVTTPTKNGPVWNGKVWIAPLDHPVWLAPLLPAPPHPSADPNKPPICIVDVTSDPFHEAVPVPIIKLGFQTIAASRYTGLYLTKRPERATKILSAASPDEQRLWKPKSLIGISAENQQWFDRRWAAIKPLAEDGWSVCASLAPLLGPIELPQDYLKLSVWTIAYGEQTTRKEDARPMKADWLRGIVRQCHSATPRIPVFIRQMSGRGTIPFDLLCHEYPALPIARSQAPSLPTAPSVVGPAAAHRIINLRQTSASGKTTIVRRLIERVGSEPLYGMFGPKRPEAHRLLCERPLFALGPYPAAGVDAVVSRFGIAGVIALLDKYAARGDVLFEALIISSMFGTVGQWLESRKSNTIIAVLDVTLADCLAGLAERQGDNPKAAKTLEDHYRRTLKVAERMRDQGLRVEMLKRDGAVDTLLAWLTSATCRK